MFLIPFIYTLFLSAKRAQQPDKHILYSPIRFQLNVIHTILSQTIKQTFIKLVTIAYKTLRMIYAICSSFKRNNVSKLKHYQTKRTFDTF